MADITGSGIIPDGTDQPRPIESVEMADVCQIL